MEFEIVEDHNWASRTDYTKCIVCKQKLPDDYEPPMCCDGRQCGCMGLPIEPPICSNLCDQLFWNNFWLEYRHMWT